ncbi:MAG: hypothetical protein LKJ94_05785 [Candidatus Methanomethylophilus sp.]|jgi:hypothetical protein|nr:hypothetical protein [Methanomethylophilus sp.]MCI2092533.1 hypothetical protein [Methanomethylophilus sp.]
MAYIPTGDDGYVPEQAIQKRYRDYYRQKQAEYDAARALAIAEGRRPAPAADLSKRDYMRTSDRVIPLKCTPEQIADWWADPASCDVQDIDCAGLPKVNVPKGMTLLQKRDQGRIRVIASPLEEQRIRRELVMGFEPGDVSKIAATSPIIQVRPMHRPVTGTYSPSDNRVTIDREQGLEQGTVVHELSHQLRATDRSRRGPIVTANPSRDIEESCTVAEQMARSDKVDYSGYYAKACVYDRKTCRWRDPTPAEARRMAEEDHMLFTEGRGKGLKGNAALRSVERHWGESHIARLRIHGSKMAVNRMADETGAVERVSMAKARTRQEAERKARTPVTNLTAGRPGEAAADIGKLGRRRVRSGPGPLPGRGAGAGTDRRPTLILIDESGDPSHTPNSSREFVMVATIKEDDGEFEKIADRTPRYTRGPRKEGEPEELKFHSSSDSVRKDVLSQINRSDARIYVIHSSKHTMMKSPGKEYEIVTKEMLKRTLSDDKVRSNPRGAKVFIDDSEYASKFDVDKTVKNAAKYQSVALDEDSGVKKSHECKPLQINDFPTGAYGARYNGGDRRFSDIVQSKSVIDTMHRNKRRRCCRRLV